MKKICIMFLLLFYSLLIIGQNNSDNYELRPALIVTNFKAINIDPVIAETVRESITGHIIRANKYRVVENSQLDKVLQLQRLSNSDLFDRNNSIKIGKMLSAKSIIVGSISKVGINYEIEARLVDIQTGEVVQGRSMKVTVQTIEFIPNECKKIAYALINIELKETDLSDYIITLLEKAKSNLKKNSDFEKKFTLTLANINYKTTNSAGSISVYIKENIENAIVNHQYFKLILATPELLVNLQNEAEKIDNINTNGILIVQYFNFTNYFELNCKIISPKNKQVLFADKIKVPKSLFPSDYTLYTQVGKLMNEAQITDSNRSNILKITIIPDKGNGSVYKNNEKLHFFFKSNQDVYIKVLLFDGRGNVTTLLPNKFQSNNYFTKNIIHKIPDNTSTFDLEAEYTGGMDVIKVIAQTEQFSDYKDVLKQVQNTGFIVDNNIPRNNVRGILTRGILTRGVRIKQRLNVKILTAEASSTMNVIK